MWRSSGPITMWSSVQLNEGGIFVMVRLVGVCDCAFVSFAGRRWQCAWESLKISVNVCACG